MDLGPLVSFDASQLHEEGLSSYEIFLRTVRLTDLSNTDLSDGVEHLEKEVLLISGDHPEFANYMTVIGLLLTERFCRTATLSDISKVIEYQEKALLFTPEGHSEFSKRLSDLGVSFQRRFGQTGELTDISSAIEYNQKAVRFTPEDDSDLPRMSNNLGVSHQYRFNLKGDLTDISKAIEYNETAVRLASDGDPNLPRMLSNLGNSSQDRFDRTGNLTDLHNAVENNRKAIQLIRDDHHPDLPLVLSNLGNSLRFCFDRTGDLTEISKAIEYHRKSLQLTPEGHSDMPERLTNLGISLSSRFDRTGDLADISEAIEHQQKAKAIIAEDHSLLATVLINLGNSLQGRFDQTGDLRDISNAIEYQQESVRRTPESHPDLPSRLHLLGNSLERLFNRGGDLSHISNAIECLQKSVRLTPEGHSDLARRLSSLGISFLSRFKRTGDLSDIFNSIEFKQQAIQLAQNDHSILPLFWNSLGVALQIRFGQTRDLTDIDNAIEYHQKAVLQTPDDHPELATRLSNTGNSLVLRYQKKGDLVDISTAIDYAQRSAELTPKGHSNLPGMLNNLGVLFQIRYVQTDNITDICNAIDYQQEAIRLTPESHAHLPTRLHNLGKSFSRRFSRTGERSDCKMAIQFFRLAATDTAGPPSTRLASAKRWIQHSLELRDFPECSHAYNVTLELLSLIASIDQTIHNRHTKLVYISKLTTEAAVFACATENTGAALEWLEQGRCLVWQQLNQLRTPVDVLRSQNALLADEFLATSRALDASGSRPQTSTPGTLVDQIEMEDQARAHLKLSQKWSQLLVKIRNLSGFEDFLRPRKATTILSQLPPDGHVVIINVHSEQCDALAFTHGSDGPQMRHIPLEDFSYWKAEKFRNALRKDLLLKGLHERNSDERGVRRARKPAEPGPLRHILQELWTEVVWPILHHLGLTSPTSHPSHIWWCPTGPLAFLPIHAAGIYSKDTTASGLCLSDFAVSSYIPTVTTLVDKFKNSINTEKSTSKVLLLSQPDTPGQQPIPATTQETHLVFERLNEEGINALILDSGEGTRSRVQEKIQSHQWVHLACHASQDSTDPLKSGFYLYDGQLNLLEIIRQQVPDAEFAYLSACQTSVGDERLSEEAVHLAAGMLAAGYRGVVATMWSIKDVFAPDIAEEFYDYLLEDRRARAAGPLDGTRAAYALDHSIQKIRKKIGDDDAGLLTWVPYVHFGL